MPVIPRSPLPERSPEVVRARATDVFCVCLVAIATAFVLAALLRAPVKDDNAWLFYVAREWLAGHPLYVDVVEVNPPLVVWLYALPVSLADWLQLPACYFVEPLVAAAAIGSAWWSACLLRETDPIFARRVPIFAVIALTLLLLPGVEFGQREHLLAIAVLPHLAGLMRRLTAGVPGRRQAVLAGVLGGLGCGLKPFFVVPLAMVELAVFLRDKRRIGLQSLSAGLAMAAYAASILVLEPAYLKQAVPMALALYGFSDAPLSQLALDSWQMLFGGAVCLGILAACWRDRARTNLLVVPTLFALGAIIVVFMQPKPWFYHRIPASVAVVFTLLAGRALLERGWPRWQQRVATSLVVGLALLYFAQSTIGRIQEVIDQAEDPHGAVSERIEALLRHEHAKSYIAFSEWIGLGFPVVNDTGVVWASRFDSMWALKGELWRTHLDGRAPSEFPVRRWVAADFLHVCPDIAVVDRRAGVVDYPSLLSAADPAFAAAWKHYARIASFDGLIVYRRIRYACPVRTKLREASETQRVGG